MSARKPPLLLRSGLTGRVYVVTSYADLGDGAVQARTKHDVTEQYNALRAEDMATTDDTVYGALARAEALAAIPVRSTASMSSTSLKLGGSRAGFLASFGLPEVAVNVRLTRATAMTGSCEHPREAVRVDTFRTAVARDHPGYSERRRETCTLCGAVLPGKHDPFEK